MGNDTASHAPTATSGIGVLDKAVLVLQAVAESPANLAALCERTGLPRATAHRLASGLEVHRLLARNESGQWCPGPALSEFAAVSSDLVRDAALTVLPRLRDITGESVQLYRREGTERVCIAAVEPPSGLRDTVPVGARLPMTAGSGGKVLLAWSEPAVRRMVLASRTESTGPQTNSPHHSSERTATDRGISERSLVEIQRRGWAQSVGEREPGVASVSAPVRDRSGEVVAAISVSGPIDRIGRRPGARWAADLLAAAEAIYKRL